jgi:GTPase SAR1 family protein
MKETINIAVIGSEGVGKSAFVQRALRLARPPSTNINAVRLEIEGVPHIVTLIELDLETFDVDPAQPVRWPKQINGHMVPRIDGALILYDVTNKDSIRELPHTICEPACRGLPPPPALGHSTPALTSDTAALGKSALPTVLVATKCDNPDAFRQLNADGMANAFPSVIANFKTSANVPHSTRDSLEAIIKAAVGNRRGKLPVRVAA